MADQVVTVYSNDHQDYSVKSNKKRLADGLPDDASKKLKVPDQIVASPKINNNVTHDADAKAKKPRKNEAICTVCEKSDNLLMCDGPCLRSFHIDCIGLDSMPTSRWECSDCSKNQNICFACKERGIINMNLTKCKVHQCGKFYHNKCISEFKLTKVVNTKSPRFNCPLHYCESCGVSGDGKQSVHCFRCPTAYHVICMPPVVKMLTKSKETRKTGLILCPKHYNEQGVVPQQQQQQLHSSGSITPQLKSPQTTCGHSHSHQHPHQHQHQQQTPQCHSQKHNVTSPSSSFFTPMSPISSPPFSPVESPRFISSSSEFINHSSTPSSPMHIGQYNILNSSNNSTNNSIYDQLKQQQMFLQLQERVTQSDFTTERPRSFSKRNSNGSVPSISTAPSPALSRSNSSEHLLELTELTSYASRLIEIRDSNNNVNSKDNNNNNNNNYSAENNNQSINNSNFQFSHILNSKPTNSYNNNNNNTFNNEIDQSKLIGQFLQFAHTKKIGFQGASILSAPSTPTNYSPHQVPSIKSSSQRPSF
ncbi:PHD zinc finger-containing protein [Heterostelium album PN500]|uniref:PHD zinc finger-containing protein n=1 Tax=Heterostelium pallidum (strain ATCC 26659 / Pp 5 / PN500) TaxID=670386 RepID=D3B878_HETP5|nr:PHD zinc finger-containing protein [Heterostelium album PN500]EFA82246.1 PHD zinc finger-containing protein [Heterostelium album PN500]|eukprot:XP_020434363.1 PHD zinc finger-containing protein [Heterostelium album PN500]